MAKLFISLLGFLLFVLSNVCMGEEMPFPFTADQNTKNEDIEQIPVKKDIQSDNWFISPPTRLELLTYVIDQYFKREVSEYWDDNIINVEKYFERQARPHGSIRARADAAVQFNSEKDMFIAWVNIENLGKPKKPMKEVCGEVLNTVAILLMGGGYLYQNTFLHTFIQKSAKDPETIRIAEKLRNNFLVVVVLDARFDKEENVFPRDIYWMQCYKLPEEKAIHYNKKTMRLPR